MAFGIGIGMENGVLAIEFGSTGSCVLQNAFTKMPRMNKHTLRRYQLLRRLLHLSAAAAARQQQGSSRSIW
jgi:hypothetical protein